MPSIRGTVHNPEKKVSFVLELEGQKATQVYIWFRNSHYNETTVTIEDVPILMMRDTKRSANSNTGDVKECNKGKIFLGELHLENIAVMSVGTFFDREQMIHTSDIPSRSPRSMISGIFKCSLQVPAMTMMTRAHLNSRP